MVEKRFDWDYCQELFENWMMGFFVLRLTKARGEILIDLLRSILHSWLMSKDFASSIEAISLIILSISVEITLSWLSSKPLKIAISF